MSIRSLPALLICVAAAVAPARAAQLAEPIANFEGMPVKTLGARPSPAQVRDAIMQAGKGRDWTFADAGPGQLIATLRVRDKHTAEVNIAYTPEIFSVSYRSSFNLKYRRDGTIHPSYNKWVTELVGGITGALARVEGAGTVPVAPPPAATPVALVTAAPAAAAVPAGRGPRSADVVVAVYGKDAIMRSGRWQDLLAQWQKYMIAAVEERGGHMKSLQDGEPRPTGEPGTLIAIKVNYFRYVGAGARVAGGVMAGKAHLDIAVRFLDLQTGAPLGMERFYSTSSQGMQGVFGDATNAQVRGLSAQIMTDLQIATTMTATTPTAAPTRQTAAASAEVSFWESVRNSRDPVELQAYLDAYPDGVFAPLARTRLAALKK